MAISNSRWLNLSLVATAFLALTLCQTSATAQTPGASEDAGQGAGALGASGINDPGNPQGLGDATTPNTNPAGTPPAAIPRAVEPGSNNAIRDNGLGQPGTEANERSRALPGAGDARDTLRDPDTRPGELPRADGRAGATAPGNLPLPRPNRGAIGMTVANGDAGLMIGFVAPNSPAFLAGLRVGDTILNIDGQTLRTIEDVTRYVSELEPGRDVALAVQRNGRPISLTARVGAWDKVYANYSAPRRDVYYPPAARGGATAEDIATLRTELQTLRDEVRQLREALRSATPNQPAENKPAENKPAESTPADTRPAENRPADAVTPGVFDRPPLP